MNLPYIYASSEVITDKLEIEMDAFKLLREEALIGATLAKSWVSALDLGCGSGRYLRSFLRGPRSLSTRPKLTALDIDSNRIERARIEANSILSEHSDIDIDVIHGDQNYLLNINKKFDIILCSHIVEHVTDCTYRDIITKCVDFCNSNGRIIFLFQVFSDEYLDNGKSVRENEYLHYIQTDLKPNSIGYRVSITPDEFDNLTIYPLINRLPVRALNIGSLKMAESSDLPFAANGIPSIFCNIPELQIEGCLVYASHLRNDSGVPVIADAIAWFRRR